MIGRVLLKRYKVERLIDEGGMSKVYLASQADQPREVVVKALKENLAQQSKVREHFKREIFILSRFQHNYSVTFFDSDGEARHPFYVMEYLRGSDLMRVLERNRKFSAERTGRLLGQLCAVLQAAHDGGIVHRDLKPGNCMVVHPDTPYETVKLMDFGLAKMSSMFYISPEELMNLAHPTASGTPEYISPEQVRGNEVDHRSDIYSLGVVLFEMLTGRRPFESTSVQQLLLAHQDETPPSFASVGLAGSVHPAIEALVRSCLAKYPEERPQSAEEVVKRYEQALGKKIAPALSLSAQGLQQNPSASGRLGTRPPSGDRIQTSADRHAIVSTLKASMPESMAMLKLKGFIHDLGGEIVESVPGLIRVRLRSATTASAQGSGLFRRLGGSRQVSSRSALQMELAMEKVVEDRVSQLSITLKLTCPLGAFSLEDRTRCEQISRDLQAYLIGR